MIVNPYATTVSSRLKNLVISALRGSFIVDAVDTERRDHATEICREAAEEGYDAVVAFGGDGTVNEAANGLAGHRHATHLPARRARQRLLPDARHPGRRRRRHRAPARLGRRLAYARQVDLGRVGGRYFLFSAGVGLDASVVERVDARPRLKARLGEYYYAWVATDDLRPPLPVQAATTCGRAREPERRGAARGCHRGDPERLALHLLRRSRR